MKSTKTGKFISATQRATEIMEELAKLFPGQDPIRIAAAVEDLEVPIEDALVVLRVLTSCFPEQDPIRLVGGFKTIRKMLK